MKELGTMSTINLKGITLGLRPRWRICSLTSIISWSAVNVSTDLFSLADQKTFNDEEYFRRIKREQGKHLLSCLLPPSQGLLTVSTLKLKDRLILCASIGEHSSRWEGNRALLSRRTLNIASPLSAIQFSKDL